MLRAVKKTDMTSLDILIDTRLYPSFVMIEKHKDWQEELEEVKDTLVVVTTAEVVDLTRALKLIYNV